MKMAKFIFDNCCFCVELRLGSFIIAYFNLIVSIIATVASIVVVVSGAALTAATDDDVKSAGVAVLIIGIITLLIVAALLAFAIVLLVGLHKRKTGHLLAYIIYSYIYLAINLILLIANIATSPNDGGYIASSVIMLLLYTYFVMVIRSYYYHMLEGQVTPPQYTS